MVGVGLLKALGRGELIGNELAVANDVELRARDLGIGRRDLGFRLRDRRLLQTAGRIEVCQCRLYCGDRALCLRQRGPVVAVVELHQEVAGTHRLVVGHRYLGDEAGDLGRDHRDVAADIRIVRALDEASDGPPLVAVPSDSEPDD